MLSKACIVGIYQRKLELIAQQQDIELLTIVPPSWKDERGEQLLECVYTKGYQLEILPIVLNGNFHLHFYRGLGKLLRKFQPDIVHIDEEPYNLATWQTLYYAKQINAKTLFFSWQNILREYPPPFSWGEKWVLNNVDYTLVGTDSAGEVWRQKNYNGKMQTIPQFGTDPEIFHLKSTVSTRPFTIGYIGRLVEEKGVHLLLEAVTNLTDDWQLQIIGGGPEKNNLQHQARNLGIENQINFIGQIPSTAMPEHYQQLDVLVLPSLTKTNWKEQFGRVLVEAMASSVAVIGSNSGAIPDVIGKAGLIFSEGNIQSLTHCLQQLQMNPELRQELGRKGRERVLEYFTHQTIADMTVNVYREMMQN